MSTFRSVVSGLTVASLLTLMLDSVSARFIRPMLETVPVTRILMNLEMQLDKNPKDVTIRLNLARTHAMAYAMKSDTAVVWQGKETQGPWFGFTPKFIPFELKKVESPDANRAAQKHLEQAIDAYRAVLKVSPDNPAARLGLAWVTEQKGEKPAAVKLYREAIEAGWKQEKDLRAGRLGGNYLTVEAAGYLIPLLNKETDKVEITDLQSKAEKLKKLPRPVTPIVVPLRSGLEVKDLVDSTARVAFDADGTGLPQRWSWVTPDAGWLVFDPKNTGRISNGSQLFGSATFWLFWDNGYQALAALDDNGDGVLRGEELRGLAIWQDRNANGVSEPGEVQPLAAFGIVELSCRAEKDPTITPSGCAAFARVGVKLRNGTTRSTFDLLLTPR